MPHRPADEDDDVLDRLRQVAAGVFIALSALLVIATVTGRQVSDGFSGLVFGTLLALVGLEGIVRIIRGGKDDEP